MTRQKIIIRLPSEDKDILNSVIFKGTSPARTIRRAHILLNSNDENDKQYTTDEMATFLHYSTGTFGSHGKNQC